MPYIDLTVLQKLIRDYPQTVLALGVLAAVWAGWVRDLGGGFRNPNPAIRHTPGGSGVSTFTPNVSGAGGVYVFCVALLLAARVCSDLSTRGVAFPQPLAVGGGGSYSALLVCRPGPWREAHCYVQFGRRCAGSNSRRSLGAGRCVPTAFGRGGGASYSALLVCRPGPLYGEPVSRRKFGWGHSPLGARRVRQSHPALDHN